MKLAAKSADPFTPPTLEVVDALLTTIVESEPKARVMSEAEPTAQAALAQLAEMTDGLDTDGAVESALWEWIVLGARSEAGEPLVDRVVERFPRSLTADELQALEALHRSHYRLMRIEQFVDDDKVRVTDLLGEDSFEVGAPGLKDRFETGRSVGCFVTPTDTGLTVMMGAWGLPEGKDDVVLERLRELRDESPLKDAPLPDFVTRVSVVVPLLIYEQLAGEVSPEDAPPPIL